VVWINEYFGEVIHPQDGRKFEELKPYIEKQDARGRHRADSPQKPRAHTATT